MFMEQTIFNPSKKSHNPIEKNALQTFISKAKISENQGDSDPWIDYVPPNVNSSCKKQRKNSKILKEIVKSAIDKENIPHYHNKYIFENEDCLVKNSSISGFTNLEADFDEFPEKNTEDTSPNIFFEMSAKVKKWNKAKKPQKTQENAVTPKYYRKNAKEKSLEKSKMSRNCSKNEETQHYFSRKELEECTFTPNIRNRSQEKRSLNEFLVSQTNFQQNKENKKKIIIENLEHSYQQNHTFHPEICPNSKKIAMSKSSNNLHQEKKLENVNKSVNKGNKIKPSTPSSAKNSEILQKKFKKTFEEIMSKHKIVEKLDSQQLFQCLVSFGMLFESSNQREMNSKLIENVWKVLKGDIFHGIQIENFYLFLKIVLRLPISSKKTQNFCRIPCDFGNFDENGNWQIDSSEEVKALQKKFELLFLNKLSSESRKFSNKTENFRPNASSISPISKALASQHKEKLKNELFAYIGSKNLDNDRNERVINRICENKDINNIDLLLLQRQLQKKQHEKMKKDREEKENSLCTFVPRLTKPRTNKMCDPPKRKGSLASGYLHNNSKQRIDKDPFEIEYEKNRKECTFQPEILKRKSSLGATSSKNSFSYVRNEQKSIERMRAARKEREFLESCRQKGLHSSHFSKSQYFDYDNKEDLVCIESTIENENEDNFNFTSEGQENQNEKLPLLFVDVNLGEKNERIVIYEQDQSEKLAKDFCRAHKLDLSTEMRLKNLLDEQIRGVLTKISEEEGPINDDENILDFYND